MKDRIEIEAHAKINLALDITGKRPDGYHEVRMIMQGIALCDRIRIERIPRKEIVGREIILKNSLPYLPSGKGNLAYDAAALFREYAGTEDGVIVELEKHIPVAAGLAGGSADAAAVLQGMNELFETGYTAQELRELGLKLGADVPFCVMGGTALSEGIGEKLTRLPEAPRFHVVLVKPPVGLSTKEVYQRFDGAANPSHPDVDGMIHAIREKDFLGVAAKLGNVLEPVSRAMCPEITEIERQMKSFGSEGTLMSGSGPTVFGLFTDRGRANAAYMHFKIGRKSGQTFLTEFA